MRRRRVLPALLCMVWVFALVVAQEEEQCGGGKNACTDLLGLDHGGETILPSRAGATSECDQWTLETLGAFAPGVDGSATETSNWNVPLKLGYTAAPLHCLERLAWDHAHLHDVQARYDAIYFMHMMKTGGSAMLDVLQRHLADIGQLTGVFCAYLNQVYNMTHYGNSFRRVNAGHGIQQGFHLKFPVPAMRAKKAFYYTTMRDPLARGISSFTYFRVDQSATVDAFFAGDVDERVLAATNYWTQDAFWYFGVEPPRSTDSALVQLDKLKRAQFVVRNDLVLISERPLESLALLRHVFGEPLMKFNCTVRRINDRVSESVPLAFQFSRKGLRAAHQRTRWVRQLYDYAVTIFELRLEQFGIASWLEGQCAGEEPGWRERGQVGAPREVASLDEWETALPYSKVWGLRPAIPGPGRT